jgi:hypothetical protein
MREHNVPPLFLAYLRNQMSTLVTPVKTFDGIFWDRNIYFSRWINGPSEPLDCMNECINIQTGVCQLFVFDKGICYLGRADVTNGSVTNIVSNVPVYSVTSKMIVINFMLHILNQNTCLTK